MTIEKCLNTGEVVHSYQLPEERLVELYTKLTMYDFCEGCDGYDSKCTYYLIEQGDGK